MIIVLGKTYFPRTGGRTSEWYRTFQSISELTQWELDIIHHEDYYDISYDVYNNAVKIDVIEHGSLRGDSYNIT